MDLSQRSLQNNGKLFKILNLFLNDWPKTGKYSKDYLGLNIDQITMCYTSVDLSQRALQTNGNFYKFQICFLIIGQKPRNIHRIARCDQSAMCCYSGC